MVCGGFLENSARTNFDGWIFASFFFCVFMDLDFVSVHKHAKKNGANIRGILTEQAPGLMAHEPLP